MSYRYQSDESPKIDVEFTIQISFPVTPLTNNDEYFSEKREASSLIVNVLKEMGATDYKVRYCLVIDGEFGEYTYKRNLQSSRFFLMPGPPQWTEIGQFVAQFTVQITQSEFDIAANLLSIIASLVGIIFTVLQREKKRQETPIIPYVTIIEGDKQLKIIGYEPKEAKELAEELSPLIKEQPVTSTERKMKIKGQFLDPHHYQPKKKRKRKK
jgi:hypothetical protein